ncbi:TetR/AcrR family transcriptional regulator [Corynebacterium glaucum]|uniref:TetR/AcrR family transcriptional regulator n=1 Tax=Corynebacterium glaucum TaxID=187491 RepID=UPI0026585F89|nr:TetR/AcrR family transcriptional regulator [Corynebacterium glaucum]
MAYIASLRGRTVPIARRETSIDPRAIRTREALVSATIDLLAAQPANELSVTAIVRAAGVSRQVFYEHFTDRDAVVLAAGRAIFEPAYTEFITTFTPDTTYPEQVTKLFARMGEHGATVRTLLDSAAQGKLNHFAVDILYGPIRTELEVHLKAANVDVDAGMMDDTAHFLAAGTQEVFARGLSEGTEPDEVARRIEDVRRTLGAFSMGESVTD